MSAFNHDPVRVYPMRRSMKGVLAFLDGVDDIEQMSPRLFALLHTRRRVRREIALLKERFDERPLIVENKTASVGHGAHLVLVV